MVIPLCGGNIDTTILGRCIDRGLAADGRLVKFTVTVSDRPGGIAELAKTLTNTGASVKDMMHERAWIKNDIFSVEVNPRNKLLFHRKSECGRKVQIFLPRSECRSDASSRPGTWITPETS